VPPERVWDSLQSDESLGAWRLPVRHLRWLTPRPFGVGTKREVSLSLGALTLREYYFRWDEGKGYSFYAESINRPGLKRFAEDYAVEPDGSGTLFTWTIAIEPSAWAGTALRALGPVNRIGFGQVTRAAKQYFAEHP